MFSYPTTGALCALLLAGCAAPGGDLRVASPAGTGGPGRLTSVSVPLQDADEAFFSASSAPSAVTPLQHSIWNSPGFQKRFAESYAAVTDVEPGVSPEEDLVIQAAQTLLAEDQLDAAIATLEEASGATATAAIDFLLANMRYQADDLEGAAAAYRLAVDKFPAFRRAWMNLGFLKQGLGDHTAAREALTEALRHGAVSSDVYGALGESTYNLGHQAAAESALRMAMLLAPENLRWQRLLADGLMAQGRTDEAASVAEGMLAVEPDNPELYEYHGRSLYAAGRLEEAAGSFELADRLGGGSPQAMLALGNIYVNQQLIGPAIAAFDRALVKAPGDALAPALRAAEVLAYNGELDAVEDLVGRVEAQAGTLFDEAQQAQVLKLRARIGAARGDDAGQKEPLLELVALDPLDGEALILLAEIAKREESFDEAALYYERAGRLEDSEAQAKRDHGILLVNQERYAEALPLLRRALDLDPRTWLEDYVEKIEALAKARQ